MPTGAILEEKRRMDVGGRYFSKAKVSRNEGGLGRGREVDGERHTLLPALTRKELDRIL